MRIGCVALAAVLSTTSLAAQATGRLSVGGTYSSALIDDGTLGTKLRPALAPTAVLAVLIPTGKGPYRVALEGSYARSPLNVTADSSHDQLAAVATITALVLAEGPIRGELHWQLGGGAIFYQPSVREGVFQDGGVRRWILAGGLVLLHPLTPAMDLVVTARIDSHEFTNDLLRAREYASAQSVQRLALLVGVSRRL